MGWGEHDIRKRLENIEFRIERLEYGVERIIQLLEHRAVSLVSQITIGGIPVGQPASIHLNSTTAQVTFEEFDQPGGQGNKVPPVGPVGFSSDTPATLTVDPASGKITPVAIGMATITTKDAGNGLSDTNLVTVVADVAQSLVASITP